MALLLSSNVDTFARKPVRSERIRVLRMSGNFFFFSLSLFKINSKEGRKRKRGIRSRSNFYRRFIKMNENRKRRKEREYYGFFSATVIIFHVSFCKRKKGLEPRQRRIYSPNRFLFLFPFIPPTPPLCSHPCEPKQNPLAYFPARSPALFALLKKKERKTER